MVSPSILIRTVKAYIDLRTIETCDSGDNDFCESVKAYIDLRTIETLMTLFCYCPLKSKSLYRFKND